MEYKEIRRGWVKEDPVRTDDLSDYAFTGESGGHKFIITAFDKNMTEITLTDTVSAKCIIANGDTIPLSGTIQNGKATVFLPGSCCTVPGRFRLSIFLTHGGSSVCIYTGIGSVVSTDTGARIDPSGVIPNLTQLQTAAETANAAAESAQSIVDNYAADVARQDAAIEGLEGRVSTLEDRADTLDDKTAVTVERGSNRYIPRTRNRGKVVYTDGTLHDDANFDTSDYIPVSVGETVMAMYWDTTNGEWGAGNPISNYAFYDANKAGLNIGGASGLGWIYGTDPFVTEEGVEVPSNAAYIRFSIRKNTIDYAPLTAWLSDKFDFVDDRDQYWNLRPEIARSEDVTREITFRIAQSELNVKTAVLANVAEEFSPLRSYAIGAKVLHDDRLHVCTVPHSGAWDAGHFDETTIASYLLRFQAVEDDGNITIELV